MGKRDEKRKLKLNVLSKIKEKKHILFCAFSGNLMKESRVKAWKDICSYAKSIGAVAADRDYTYLRDVWFNNIKKLTAEKIYNARKFGSAEGSSTKFHEVDICVQEIVGKDKLVPPKLGIPDLKNNVERDVLSDESLCTIIMHNGTPKGLKRLKQPIRKEVLKKNSTTQTIESEETYRIKNLKLEAEVLEKDNYLKSLQILKLEQHLGLPPSIYTQYLCKEHDSRFSILEVDTDDNQ